MRTGKYKYVRYKDYDTYIRAGWLPIADLGLPHGEYSLLMWLCALSCKESR